MSEINLKDIALHYWREGWNVIPVGADKRPLVKWKEWQIYRQTEDSIALMSWDKSSGIAGITGQIYSAIDVDKECLKKSKKLIQGLPKTRIHRTPSGGIHLIYKSKKACSSSDKLREPFGIEVQGIGNYIVLPPSFNGKYTIENPDTPIAEVDDLEALIYERAKALGWEEKEEGLSFEAKSLEELDSWEVKCVRFFADNPFPESSRELIIGKNFAILCLSTLKMEEIEPFVVELVKSQPDFSKIDILSWLKWAREKPRKFNCSEVSNFIRKHYPDFCCEGCPILKIPKKEHKDYPPCSLEELMDYWHENYYIEDDAPILTSLAVSASHKLDGDPVWIMLVGPPSSIKSEIIRALGDKPNEMIYPLSTLTPNTLISGYGEKNSLLPKINGKVLTLKDFTTILEMDKRERNEILAQLREVYDGYFSKATGGEANYQLFKCKITLIAGVVSAIDLYESIQSLLGDRFLKIRTEVGDIEKISKYAKRLCGREDEARKKLHELTMGFLRDLKVGRIELDEKADSYLVELASFVARARTPVVRDCYGVIQYMPQSEGIARVYKQFLKLSWSFASILGKREIDDIILGLLTRIAVDTIDQRRILVLQALRTDRIKKTSVVAMEVGMPTETVRRILEDLALIGFVTKSGDEDRGYEWALTEEVKILQSYCKAIKYENCKISNEQIETKIPRKEEEAKQEKLVKDEVEKQEGQCGLCNKTFPSLSDLLDHIRSDHKDE